MKKFLLAFCLITGAIAQTLHAQHVDPAPDTHRTEDKRYVTTGSMTISAPIEQSVAIIEDTDHWNEWMLAGMDGTGNPDRFLLVYITGIEFIEEARMSATVEFRFLRNLGKDPATLHFMVSRHYTENGTLEQVTAVLLEKNSMLESARYDIMITGNAERTIITYTANIRLRGFFEFFVTLNSYKKTIEWYLERIMTNFVYEISP